MSLFYYFDPLYVGFGSSAMWAVLTVIVVFEFSVGKFYHLSLILYVPFHLCLIYYYYLQIGGISEMCYSLLLCNYLKGATLGKGLNRGLATFLAGTLGFGAHHLATLPGEKVQPILLGIFVFLIGK